MARLLPPPTWPSPPAGRSPQQGRGGGEKRTGTALSDLILLNARTHQHGRVDVALRGSSLLDVAPAGTLAQGTAQTLDLKDAWLTPGLWDSHIHLFHWAQMRHQLALSGCTSREQVIEAVAAGASGGGPGWLLGQGWNSAGWADPRPPSRWELDAVTGDRPTLLWCSDLHSALANSAALAASGLLEGERQVEGGVIERDESGQPTGWLREMAANLARDAMPPPDDELLSSQLLQAQSELHRLGITGLCDQRIKDQNDGPLLFRLLRALEARGQWRLRTNLNVAAHHLAEVRTLGLSTGFGSDWLRLGHMKLFADGTLGSLTARMLQPFLGGGPGADGRGLYLTSPGEMEETFGEAARAGFSISVHAIGDEAVRVCLDLFEGLERQGLPRPRIPHRLEHAQILDDADVDRFAALGVVASVQGGHLLDDRVSADLSLGPRARLCYRFGDLARAGATLIFGTDAPVSEVDPRYGIRASLQRCLEGGEPWYPEQRLEKALVLRGYTEEAVRAAGWDDLLGERSWTVGARADLVVWSEDPLESPRAEALRTFVDGRQVHGAP